MRSRPGPETPHKTPRAPPYVVQMRDTLIATDATTMPLAHRAVLLDLATYAAPNGTRCYPAIDTIRAALGMSRRKIYSVINELESARWIVRTRRTRSGPDGGQTSNGYTLHLRGGPIVVARRTIRGRRGIDVKPISPDVLRAHGIPDLRTRRPRTATHPTHT